MTNAETIHRWLRQPLLDIDEISFRHNIVELFAKFSVQRDRLRDGPLKAIPDLDTIANK
jgi:DNA mismatch repair protein MSH2